MTESGVEASEILPSPESAVESTAFLMQEVEDLKLIDALANIYTHVRSGQSPAEFESERKAMCQNAKSTLRTLHEIGDDAGARTEFQKTWGREKEDLEQLFDGAWDRFAENRRNAQESAPRLTPIQREGEAMKAAIYFLRKGTKDDVMRALDKLNYPSEVKKKVALSFILMQGSSVAPPTAQASAAAWAAVHPFLENGNTEQKLLAVAGAFLFSYGAALINSKVTIQNLTDTHFGTSASAFETVPFYFLKKVRPENVAGNQSTVVKSGLTPKILGDIISNVPFILAPNGASIIFSKAVADGLCQLATAASMRTLQRITTMKHRASAISEKVASFKQPVTRLNGGDFGLEHDIAVEDIRLNVTVTESVPVPREADFHAYLVKGNTEENLDVKTDLGSDAVCISGLNSPAHDFIHASEDLGKHHRTMAFFGHTDAADAKPDNPDIPFNTDSFAPSGEAFLNGIQKLTDEGKIRAGVTVYTHSTGAAVVIEAIRLDEAREARGLPRLIRQAVLIAPAGIVEIGSKDVISAALNESMGQAFKDEIIRAKRDRKNRKEPVSARIGTLIRKQLADWFISNDTEIQNAANMRLIRKTDAWKSIRMLNTVHELVEQTLANHAFLDDTAKRVHVYWPKDLPHYWPWTVSALHNMDLIATNCTEAARKQIKNTPIRLIFFSEDRLVQQEKLLTEQDRKTIVTTELTEAEFSEFEARMSQQYRLDYDSRMAARLPFISRTEYMTERRKRLNGVKQGIARNDLLKLRTKEAFTNNMDRTESVSLSFAHHMSQRRRMDDILRSVIRSLSL